MGDERKKRLSVAPVESHPAVLKEGCAPSGHEASRFLDTGMAKRIDKHLDELKQEIAAEVVTQVVGEMRKLAKLLRESGPEAVTKPIACVRLGIGMTKLKGMIRCREISICVIGGKEMIPTEEIRRLTQPILRPPVATKRRGGGRRKSATYDPLAEFEALGKPRRKS